MVIWSLLETKVQKKDFKVWCLSLASQRERKLSRIDEDTEKKYRHEALLDPKPPTLLSAFLLRLFTVSQDKGRAV